MKQTVKKGILKRRSIVIILAFAFFILSSTALIIFGGIQLFFNLQSQNSAITNSQKMIAQEAAHSVSSFVSDKMNTLSTALWVTNPLTLPSSKQRDFLQSLLGLQPAFLQLILYNDTGEIISRVSKRSLATSGKVNKEYLSEAENQTKTNDFYISSVYIDRVTNEPLVIISIPIKNVFSELQGMLLAEVNLKFMWDLVESIKVGNSGYVYVVDRKGNLISFGDASRVLKGENVEQITSVRNFINNTQSIYAGTVNSYIGINNERVIGSYEPLMKPDWAVVIEVPWKEAYQKTITETTILIVVLFVISTLISILGIFLSRKLSIPIVKLMNTATQIAAGDRKLQAEIEGPHEISELASSFNSMTAQLRNSLEAVEDQLEEIRKAEEAVRIAKFSIDQSFDSIFWMDENATFTYVNDQACNSLGYLREELLGMKLWQIDPSFTEDKWLKAEEAYKKGQLLSGTKIESAHRRKDGSLFPVEIVSNHLLYDRRELHVHHVRDVSERKRAEAELMKAKNYITRIINSMPSIIIGVDKNYIVTLWNNRAEMETGISAETALSTPLREVFPRFRSEMNILEKAIMEREVQSHSGVTHERDNGIFYEDITVFPIVAENIEGAVIRIDDRTEQKRVEEMIIQSEKMLSVGGLAAGMAHEINNPLAGILQNTEILKRRLAESELPANIRAAEKIGIRLNDLKAYLESRDLIKIMESIHSSGKRAAEIVKNMLSFARKGEKSFVSCNIIKLLDDTILLAQTDYNFKKKYDFKKIQIVKMYEKNLPLVRCESSKIQLVFLNLLKNGAEAMGEYGTYDDSQMKFILRLLAKENYIQIEIEDNGKGMDEKTRKRIFEPFFTTKPVGYGTGLGLSVSYFIIVENHGGTMNVESQINGGTKFIIKLKRDNV